MGSLQFHSNSTQNSCETTALLPLCLKREDNDSATPAPLGVVKLTYLSKHPEVSQHVVRGGRIEFQSFPLQLRPPYHQLKSICKELCSQCGKHSWTL